MTAGAALLDTDTLSEVIKGRDLAIQSRAQEYLGLYQRFTFSLITRYEILRGLKAKDALAQVRAFEAQCLSSTVLPLTDGIVVKAADIFAMLRKRGGLISDADILIAATALAHSLVLITNNLAHFQRIDDLRVESWRSPAAF
jgi:tRNA(fMet)-specific endonuclease VapC